MNSLITNHEAGAAVTRYRIVKNGSSDNTVIHATSGASALVGITGQLGADSGDRVDVCRSGIEPVELGGTVTRGAWLTSDANGKAVAATIVAGTAVHVIGQAEIAGVSGDLINCRIQPTVIANDTEIYSTVVTVTTGQLLALNATPKTLVAAPGAGKAIIMIDAQAELDYNSVAYDGIAAGEDLAFRYTNGSGAIVAEIETTGFLDQTADTYRHVYPLADAAKVPAANAALVLHLKSGEIATGNSPLNIKIRYRIADLALV